MATWLVDVELLVSVTWGTCSAMDKIFSLGMPGTQTVGGHTTAVGVTSPVLSGKSSTAMSGAGFIARHLLMAVKSSISKWAVTPMNACWFTDVHMSVVKACDADCCNWDWTSVLSL